MGARAIIKLSLANSSTSARSRISPGMYAKRAERDLDELKKYLAVAAGSEITRRVMRDLRDAFAFLGREPQAGHSREDLHGEGD